MDYRSFVKKTVTMVEERTTTFVESQKHTKLVGKLTTQMGSKDVGDEVVVEAPSKSLGLSDLKEKLNGLLTREGSSGEIGWAMETTAVAPVHDETDLFYSIWDDLKNQELGCSNEEMRAHSYLLVPGLFCNSYPTYFREILAYFKDIGLDCEFAHINTEGAVKSNAAEVRDIIVAQHEQFGKTVVLVGHSKGGTDAAAACAMYWDELKDKVRGLIMLQSPYGGTPLAADLLNGGQFGALNSVFLGKLASFSNPDGTVEAVKDLTYKNRRAFLEEHPMPSDVPTLCFHSNFPPDSITRFKRYMLKQNLLSGRVVVPLEMQLGKQLALMSRYILGRYPGVESDGLVTRKDAEVPGTIVVKFREELAHTLVIPEVFPAVHKSDEIVPPPLNASLVCQACIMVLLTTR